MKAVRPTTRSLGVYPLRRFVHLCEQCPTRRDKLGCAFGLTLLILALLAVPVADAQVSWRPGFTQCVTSLDPSQPNYFSNTAGCSSSNPTRHWLVGVQSEDTLGEACVGTNAQSLPINVGGPMSLTYEPYQGAWAARLHTDFWNFRHPCVDNVWTWFSIMDHASSGGGPLPNTNDLSIYIRGIYNEVRSDETALAGISRMGVTLQGWWAGKSVLVDAMLYVHPNWGDAHPDSDIILAIETPAYYYVIVKAEQWQLNSETSSTIHFGPMIDNLIARALLPDGPRTWISAGAFTETHTTPETKISAGLLLEDFLPLPR